MCIEHKSNKLKVTFLGGSINSAVGKAHFSSISIDGRFDLVAGCFSRDGNVNLASASVYGVSPDRVYASIDELIKNEKNNIDAVIILTPTDQHLNNVSTALNNNIPVICEKSLALSVDEAIHLKTLTNKNNSFLAVIYNYLGYPIIRELRKFIKNGTLGIIRHIQIEMPLENYALFDNLGNPVGAQEWRLKDGAIPTISLDLGVHLHMLVKYLTNEQPLKVIAKSSSLGNHSSVIDNVNCIIEYTKGLTCNMWFSKIALGNRNGMKIRLYGDVSSAEWVQEKPEVIHMADNNGKRWVLDRGNPGIAVANQNRYTRFKVGHPGGFIEAFANYYNDIAECLANYKNTGIVVNEDCFGVNEAIEGLRLFEAVQKSSESLSWEDV